VVRKSTGGNQNTKTKSSPPPRVQFRATLDQHSVQLLQGLSRHLRQKPTAVAAQLILSLNGNKKLSTELAQFYIKTWPDLEPRKIESGKLFNWVVGVDEALRNLSWDAIGTGNKSETVRVLIAFFAKRYKVVTPKTI